MLELVEKDGVAFIKSSLIKSRHGFSTRHGGFSSLGYTSSLNLAFGRGDDRETVLKNLGVFASALEVDAKRVISVPQIHSADVRTVTLENAGAGYYAEPEFECDGYVTAQKDLPIGVKTADCVPILLEGRDEADEVIAVAALHAGWRGTAARIAEKGIEQLLALGVKKEKIYVAIGACIDACCYEVGIDFVNEIKNKLGQNYENKFINSRHKGSYFADLKGMNLEIISECGVPRENVDVCKKCTCCETELFYSHRRQRGVRGAMLSLICK